MLFISNLILFQQVRMEQGRISNCGRCFSMQFCDHIEKIAEDIAQAAELPCVLGTAHLPKGYTQVTEKPADFRRYNFLYRAAVSKARIEYIQKHNKTGTRLK